MTDIKTVVLSAIDNSNKKAVLSLQNDSGECFGSIRLYNFKEIPHGILTLGFLIDTQVYKAALTEKSSGLYNFNFKLSKDAEKFSCALINILGGEPKPLLIGASEKNPPKDLSDNLVKNFKLLDDTNLSANEARERLDSCEIDYDDEEKEVIDKAIKNEMGSQDRCSRCGYRNAFYGSEDADTKTTEKFKESPKRFYPMDESKGNFYDEIKDQLTILFERYPEETFLNEVIPDSKWVKVDYEDDGQYFVIGLIYENEKVQYVCYGSPGEYSADPPREFKGLSQWLPLDPDKPEELGYWIIYQDADSGENVEIKIS